MSVQDLPNGSRVAFGPSGLPPEGLGVLFFEGNRDAWTDDEGDATTLSRDGHEAIGTAHELIRNCLFEGRKVVVVFDDKLATAVMDLIRHAPTVAGAS